MFCPHSLQETVFGAFLEDCICVFLDLSQPRCAYTHTMNSNSAKPTEAYQLVNLTASHDNKSPRQKQRIFYDSSPELFPRRISHERTNLKFTFSFDDTASESLSHDLAGTLLPKEPATPLHDAVVVEFEPLMAGPLLPYSRAPFDFFQSTAEQTGVDISWTSL